jgi:lysozyme family protein
MMPLRYPPDVLSQTRFIVEQFEGGISDHPSDRGGLTRYGVTLRLFAAFLRLPVNAPRVREQFDALTRDDAYGVIAEMFAMRPNLHVIRDPRLRFAVLDYAVNSGDRTAIKALQQAAGVEADGILGRITESAVNSHPDPDWLRERVMDARYQHLGRIVVRDRTQLAFLVGWLIRLGRVAAWRQKVQP